MNQLIGSSERESLEQEMERCQDRAMVSSLAARLLGCAPEHFTAEGPVWCALGNGVSLGEWVHLSAGCAIWDLGPVRLGDCVVCGSGVKIRAEEGRGVWIGDRVWIGEGVEIEPGSRIGDDAIICAGVRVEREVAAGAVVMGNPRRVVRKVR